MESSTRMIFHRSPSFSSQSSALSMSGSLYSKGSMQRFGVTPSVYGGAGGHGTRISTSRQLMSYGGEFTGGDLFGGNEKTVMQSLNDRLASYLEKVQSLEQSNSKLEVLIRQWYEANAPITSRDYSAYYKQIEELQSQIKKAQLENAQHVLQIDNAKLAAEDFRLKYETERSFRVTVEADLLGLNKVLDDLTLSKTDLEVQIEQLTKDLIVLKKEHEEEVSVLSKQLGNNVNVEVDATPGLNLSTIMSEMREKYEGIVQKNLQEARHHFEIETKILQEQVTGSTEEIKEYEIQIKELRRTYQNLEIELQSQLSMKESLECTLEETNARYSSQLASIQEQLNSLEAHLMQMRADAVHQSQEYSILLDLKTRLEQEIATYRRLLEGDILVEKDPKKNRKVTTIVEEVVDGKVVSSEVRTVNENQ